MYPDAAFVDQVIDCQRRAIRWHLVFALGVFALGPVIICAGVMLKHPKVIEQLSGTVLGVGGAFVSSLSVFPLGSILSRSERLTGLRVVREGARRLDEDQSIDQTQRTYLQELLRKLLEKIALG